MPLGFLACVSTESPPSSLDPRRCASLGLFLGRRRTRLIRRFTSWSVGPGQRHLLTVVSARLGACRQTSANDPPVVLTAWPLGDNPQVSQRKSPLPSCCEPVALLYCLSENSRQSKWQTRCHRSARLEGAEGEGRHYKLCPSIVFFVFFFLFLPPCLHLYLGSPTSELSVVSADATYYYLETATIRSS